mmetsp:Transcript_38570/g.28445  ORF Transcript_38570/g.28445 Transcript_38570/m.28445 type:complete len:103 (+) Transcript_38570:202-510(+)
MEFKEATVVKHQRVFQCVFYLLGYEREQICERGTNKIQWKKAKELLNEDFFKRLAAYKPIGPKEGKMKEYQKLRFLERNMEGLEIEHIDEYSLAMGKLFRWL